MPEDTDLPEFVTEKDTDGIGLVADRSKVTNRAVADTHECTESRRGSENQGRVRNSEGEIGFCAFVDQNADDLHFRNSRRRVGAPKKKEQHFWRNGI
jgi:hypothetical protein